MKNKNNPLVDNELIQTESVETVESEAPLEAAEATDDVNPEISELDKAKQEASDWKDKYVRLYAEFDNFRHRTSKEKIALIGTATENLMVDLLPIVDDFERTQKAIESSKDLDSIKEGVSLVFHKFIKVLNNKGLQAVESIGKTFDPEAQEAITQIPSATPDQKGKVVDEVEKGYTLNNKTIRFAKVVIGA